MFSHICRKSWCLMKISSPPFGYISGIFTGIGLLPHIFTMVFFLTIGLPPNYISFLVIFTIGAKLLGEWLFWNYFKKRINLKEELTSWRSVIDRSLLSHPNVLISLLMFCTDIVVDVILIHIALQTSISPIWIFLGFLVCQALFSPIQGFLSDCFSRRKSLLFASFMGIFAVFLAKEILLDGSVQETSIYSISSLIGLSSFKPSVQMLLILCSKGILANLTVIARAAIA
ncbi:MAG: hypothetical protein K1000chlam3_00001, partial [Chlamydiae bacterium]|nr:hypothetical protein [Chlamydiota bacterium]